jgi:hypothetical protein
MTRITLAEIINEALLEMDQYYTKVKQRLCMKKYYKRPVLSKQGVAETMNGEGLGNDQYYTGVRPRE